VLCGHIHERYRVGNVLCAGSSTERGAEGYWVIEVADGRLQSAAQYRAGGLAAAG
jgi:hypothetical protein